MPSPSTWRVVRVTYSPLALRSSLGALAVVCSALMAWSAPSAAQEAAAQDDSDLAAESSAGSASAEATDVGRSLRERIRAVSAPVFVRRGRFAVAPYAGLSANDAFFERLQVGARASYHLLESLSLDAGAAANLISIPLNSARLLQEEQLELTDPTKLYGYFDVSATFAPIYGKASLMSELVMHFDAYASGGVGALAISLPDGSGLLGDVPIQPAASLAVGARVFINQWLVVRAELRDYTYWGDFGGGAGVQTLLFANVGVGFYFPMHFQTSRVLSAGEGS